MKIKSFRALAALVGVSASVFGSTLQDAHAQPGGDPIAINGQVAPFTLPDTAGNDVSVGDWSHHKATALLFIATRCPVSQDYNARIARLSKAYSTKGVQFFGINSNKQEAPDEIAQQARESGFTFPVLKDMGNKVADRFGTKVAPEVYLIDSAGKLVYRGQIDDNRHEEEVKARPFVAALDAVVAGKVPVQKEAQAFGCAINRVN